MASVEPLVPVFDVGEVEVGELLVGEHTGTEGHAVVLVLPVVGPHLRNGVMW